MTNQQHRYTGTDDDPDTGKAPLAARQRRTGEAVFIARPDAHRGGYLDRSGP